MITLKSGGPAFPQHGWSNNPEIQQRMKDQGGMTLRDYFAAAALPSILAQDGDGISGRAPSGVLQGGTAAQWWAKDAYEIADAMIAARGAA